MGSAVGRAAVRPGAVYDQFGVFFPKHLDKGSELYQSLHSTSQMESWGLNLADSAANAVGKGVGHAAPYIILVLLVAAHELRPTEAGRGPQSRGQSGELPAATAAAN